MAVSTPLSTQLRIKLNDGVTPTGQAKTKNMNMFSTGLVKTTLDQAGIDAFEAVVSAFNGLSLYAINQVEMIVTNAVSYS